MSDSGKGEGINPLESKPLNVNVDSPGLRPLPTNDIKHEQEKNAKYVASMILWTFAGAMFATFLLLIVLVMTSFYHPTIVLTTITPALDNFTRFVQLIGTIFSPLLAFILGFYFSNSRRHHSDKDSDNVK